MQIVLSIAKYSPVKTSQFVTASLLGLLSVASIVILCNNPRCFEQRASLNGRELILRGCVDLGQMSKSYEKHWQITALFSKQVPYVMTHTVVFTEKLILWLLPHENGL